MPHDRTAMIGPVGQRTVFRQTDSLAWLSQLGGVRCAGDDENVAPMFRTPAVLSMPAVATAVTTADAGAIVEDVCAP